MSAAAAPGCARREGCRLCGSRRLRCVLQLAPTPPANAFVTAPQLAEAQARYPLDLHFCEDCAHLQLLDVVDPQALFSEYLYVSGTSPAFVAHFERYAEDCVSRLGLAPNSLVVDVGSNDGTLLTAFRKAGMRVLGIDPAREIARRASAAGIETVADFLTPGLAAALAARHGRAALVTANNVFAHVDDLTGFVDAVRALLAPKGAFVFEVSYLADVVRDTLFDTIYHEHLSYHSVQPLLRFFGRCAARLEHVQRVATHGGSLRATVRFDAPGEGGAGTVAALIREERTAGIDHPETFERWGAKIDSLGRALSAQLRIIRARGESIAGYGAPAKATTLMHQFGIGRDLIEYIVDDSPFKQGLYTPGLGVPVVDAQALRARPPDYLLLLAWNFAEAIIERQRWFLDRGGRFIVPMPRIRMVTT